jgi:CheY-like chemotaxis protein
LTNGPQAPRSVLVIEPDAALRRTLTRMFSMGAWQCFAAESMAAGVSRLRDTAAPDLMVCDLPSALALVVIAAGAAIDQGLDPSRVIFHGASVEPTVAAYLRRLGFEVLTKPESLTLLRVRAGAAELRLR